MMGLPGSGKTTYCAKYLASYKRLSADDFMMDEMGLYRYSAERVGDAHAAVKREFSLWACGEGMSGHVVVDNTNVCIEDVAFFIETALAFGHTVQVLFLRSLDAFDRQVHGVPLKSWLYMADRAKLTILSWPARWPKITIVET